ncbi:menaquinone-dependent protoporphyrinogen IX dehydrogenase [Paracoccaceae bacterium]|nr:menaquinone-dependent protoporphyrinogen IX dehydrogenase [Paracoccaceae bacterium]|tara:strand:- start:390 stop:908 length:519 start_codon:yes stop_codon:yes gene_type:complete
MKNTLIIYSTTDGQTKRICDRLIGFSDKKKGITLCAIENASEKALDQYSKVVIGASIRYGKHSPLVYEFIELNREELEKKQTAFFTVNVVARKKEKNQPDTNPYMKKFLEISRWRPNKLAVFAGRIDYPSYRFFDRLIIRFIMLITKGPTDTSQIYEFTDWKKVEKFAKEVL